MRVGRRAPATAAADAAARSGSGILPGRRAAAIQGRLLRWYRASRRSLPWRERPDPYRVWVAEVMLQQTQVATVVPYYDRFLARFPDLRALASASEEEVLALWSGLGYYSRARNLHRAARLVVERHGGRLPAARAALEALPGIGRYTAGAILSIAFGREEPVVDGNVRRLLSRLLLPSGAASSRGRRLAPAPPSPALLEAQARALVSGAPAADLNQALMELGALVCRPVSPRCSECPLAPLCGALRLGLQERVPAPRWRLPTQQVARVVALIRRGSRVLMQRSDGPGAPRGLWDLPGTLVPEGADPRAALRIELERRRLKAKVGRAVARVDHTITYRRIRTTAYEARLREPVPPDPSRRWMDPGGSEALALGAAARRLLESIPPRGTASR